MTRQNISLESVISQVRAQLPNGENRIAEKPLLLGFSWWPDRGSQFDQFPAQIQSDYGIVSGPKEITDEFMEEISKIHESLDKMGYQPSIADWQRQKGNDEQANAARSMYRSLNLRASAIGVWEKIAIPFRFRGEIVFRIFPPRDVFGSPMVEPMLTRNYILGIAAHSVDQSVEIGKQGQSNKRLKIALGVSVAIILLIYADTILRIVADIISVLR